MDANQDDPGLPAYIAAVAACLRASTEDARAVEEGLPDHDEAHRIAYFYEAVFRDEGVRVMRAFKEAIDGRDED